MGAIIMPFEIKCCVCGAPQPTLEAHQCPMCGVHLAEVEIAAFGGGAGCTTRSANGVPKDFRYQSTVYTPYGGTGCHGYEVEQAVELTCDTCRHGCHWDGVVICAKDGQRHERDGGCDK